MMMLWKRLLQNHFASFSAACLTASCVTAYVGWQAIAAFTRENNNSNGTGHHQSSLTPHEQQQQRQHHSNKQGMHIQAMIENALQSSWKENLDNAVTAHERFMLPGRQHHDGDRNKLLQKINARVEKLQQDEKKQQELNNNHRDQDSQQQEDKIQFWK